MKNVQSGSSIEIYFEALLPLRGPDRKTC